MADKKLTRYSTSTVMGVAVHTVSERGEWVKYEDAAELEAENKLLRDEREILENLAHSQARNSGEESDRADKAEARLTAALEVLKAVEWVNFQGAKYCPKCAKWKRAGHASDCTLDAVLNKGEGNETE